MQTIAPRITTNETTSMLHHFAWRRTVAILALGHALGGCAITAIEPADARQAPTPGLAVVEGRINYIIDGVPMAPYGGFRPRWPAPRFAAVHLESGMTHVSPPVGDDDGRFRWQLKPGSYVLTRIGVGNFTDDTYLAWPGVVLCVPAAAGPWPAGHLRLEGRRYDEVFTYSTGESRRSRGVRYDVVVDDEAAGAAPRFGVRRGLPVGERFFELMRDDRQRLLNESCAAP